MKKVIALALTLAMVLALGVTAFAAEILVNANGTNGTAEYEVGTKTSLIINMDNAKDEVTKVYDSNNTITFGTATRVDGTATQWVVEATMDKLGLTQIIVDYTDANSDEQQTPAKIVNVVDAPEADQPGDDYLALADVQAMLDAWMDKPTSVIALDVTGKDGIAADLYNAVAKLNPEVIELYTDVYTIRLYRGDYTKLTIKSNVEINTMVTVSDTLLLKNKDANNRVLTALGNKNADPFYVEIDSTNLTEIAANPELSVVLDTEDFAAWCKTNNCKAMDIYAFDPADDTVALVKENVSVNNLFDNVVEMPTLDSAIYVFVDADNSATGSANVKPNTNTGANDMVAVAVVFATIALAAGVSKKVR